MVLARTKAVAAAQLPVVGKVKGNEWGLGWVPGEVPGGTRGESTEATVHGHGRKRAHARAHKGSGSAPRRGEGEREWVGADGWPPDDSERGRREVGKVRWAFRLSA